ICDWCTHVKLLGESIFAFVSPKGLLHIPGEWTRRDSNPHLRLGQSAVLPLHHGPSAVEQELRNMARLSATLELHGCFEMGTGWGAPSVRFRRCSRPPSPRH